MTKCDKVVSKSLLRGHAHVVRHPSNQKHKSRRRGHLDGKGQLKKSKRVNRICFNSLNRRTVLKMGGKNAL